MVGIIAMIATLLVLAKIAWSIDDWSRDFTCNHARLDDAAQNPSLRPVTMPVPPTEVRSQLEDWVDAQRRWSIKSVRGNGATVETPVTMHLTRTTPLMRYVDDIHVTIVPVAMENGTMGSRIDAASQSRIGKGDLGQNPRNLIELTEALTR